MVYRTDTEKIAWKRQINKTVDRQRDNCWEETNK